MKKSIIKTNRVILVIVFAILAVGVLYAAYHIIWGEEKFNKEVRIREDLTKLRLRQINLVQEKFYDSHYVECDSQKVNYYCYDMDELIAWLDTVDLKEVHKTIVNNIPPSKWDVLRRELEHEIDPTGLNEVRLDSIYALANKKHKEGNPDYNDFEIKEVVTHYDFKKELTSLTDDLFKKDENKDLKDDLDQAVLDNLYFEGEVKAGKGYAYLKTIPVYSQNGEGEMEFKPVYMSGRMVMNSIDPTILEENDNGDRKAIYYFVNANQPQKIKTTIYKKEAPSKSLIEFRANYYDYLSDLDARRVENYRVTEQSEGKLLPVNPNIYFPNENKRWYGLRMGDLNDETVDKPVGNWAGKSK